MPGVILLPYTHMHIHTCMVTEICTYVHMCTFLHHHMQAFHIKMPVYGIHGVINVYTQVHRHIHTKQWRLNTIGPIARLHTL